MLDPLGNPLDGKGPVDASEFRPVEVSAAGVAERQPVCEPLQTGIKVIDAAIPIGRGQRELILGDRQTGKTTIALEAILNQKDTGVVSIYCAIGQRASAVARKRRIFSSWKDFLRCASSILYTSSSMPTGLRR